MTITEKENLMRVINGQEPAWLPRKVRLQYPDDPENHKLSCQNAVPKLHPEKRGENGARIDIFGVEYLPADSVNGTQMPRTDRFILDDITKWRDVIKVPSLEGIDWEAVARQSTEHIDRRETAVEMGTNASYFQHLMRFMGFTEGLCALQEEPDEVWELFEYLAGYYEAIATNLIDYIKPDIYGLTDDNATARSPFISREMYQRMLKPFQVRLANIANDRGVAIGMHDCGRCEDFIEDWVEFGVKLWNPAQTSNDLAGIKKKYGKDFVLVGCWDSQGPAGWPGAEEELVRQAVRDCIDAYAPGGGFCFRASLQGAKGDEQARIHSLWITDEYNKYGRTFYK